MKNIAFVIWMIMYPLTLTASEYVQYLTGKHYSNDVEALSALTNIIIWIYVGIKIYEKPKSE